jgi:hypothetical protein
VDWHPVRHEVSLFALLLSLASVNPSLDGTDKNIKLGSVELLEISYITISENRFSVLVADMVNNK